jgi:hypothetical protein
MLCSARELQGTAVEASDGRFGSIDAFLFDDVSWVIRYLTVDTGTWLPGRRVLISPISIDANHGGTHLRVRLTREQIRNAPDIDTDQPVSRQMEVAFHGYYGYAPYWGGGAIWGSALYPAALSAPAPAGPTATLEQREGNARHGRAADPHLRSTQEVRGYHLEAIDGEVGHVDDFLIDNESWAIWRLVVDTSNWPGGRSVLVSPAKVRAIEWGASRLHVEATKASIRAGPEFHEVELLRRRSAAPVR